ncbi:MAG: methionine--tRNA ligase subunit beta, partial [Planctomycetes bacterium]|nr:methionine--tRNA ligase subunit beta [Planctomycetota bacterium]
DRPRQSDAPVQHVPGQSGAGAVACGIARTPAARIAPAQGRPALLVGADSVGRRGAAARSGPRRARPPTRRQVRPGPEPAILARRPVGRRTRSAAIRIARLAPAGPLTESISHHLPYAVATIGPQPDLQGAPMPDEIAAEPVSKPQITFDEFARIDLRVVKVIHAENHPNADRLLVLKLDDGSGQERQVCAGIKAFYNPEDLVGRSVVIVANLAPRTIRGQESRGMILAASDAPRDDTAGERNVVVLTPMGEIPPGSIVS